MYVFPKLVIVVIDINCYMFTMIPLKFIEWRELLAEPMVTNFFFFLCIELVVDKICLCCRMREDGVIWDVFKGPVQNRE